MNTDRHFMAHLNQDNIFEDFERDEHKMRNQLDNTLNGFSIMDQKNFLNEEGFLGDQF